MAVLSTLVLYLLYCMCVLAVVCIKICTVQYMYCIVLTTYEHCCMPQYIADSACANFNKAITVALSINNLCTLLPILDTAHAT